MTLRFINHMNPFVSNHDLLLPRVNSYQAHCVSNSEQRLALQSHSGYPSASSDLNHRYVLQACILEPLVESDVLLVGTLVEPLVVLEQKDIWSGRLLAASALRNMLGFKGLIVEIKLLTPTLLNRLTFCTLKMENRTVAFLNLCLIKACFLKMTINVRSVYKSAFIFS